MTRIEQVSDAIAAEQLRISEASLEEVLQDLHAGSYVHERQTEGLSHWEANRVNDKVRSYILDRARQLGINPDKVVKG